MPRTDVSGGRERRGVQGRVANLWSRQAAISVARSTCSIDMGPIDFGRSVISGRTAMSEDNTISRSELLALTGEIVSAHLANNAVSRDEVAPLIQSVFDKLSTLASDEAPSSVEPRRRCRSGDRSPTTTSSASKTEEAEDAEAALMTAYNMTPEEYRAKWG
ncbi:MAG: MucR family transcriptional regulator [Amaricoccus sp.]